jgi:hypothetical protein
VVCFFCSDHDKNGPVFPVGPFPDCYRILIIDYNVLQVKSSIEPYPHLSKENPPIEGGGEKDTMVQQSSLLKWLTYKLNFNFLGKRLGIGKASLWVLFLASIFRLVFLTAFDSPFYFAKYPYFASQLSKGGDIGVRIVDLSPFYLYFLTAWHTCFGPSWSALKVLQSVLGVVNCWLIFRIGVRFFNPKVALIAGIIAASYGNLIVLESTIEPVVFVLTFNLLAVYFLSGIKDHASSVAPTAKTVLMSGFFTGLSVITKPSFLVNAGIPLPQNSRLLSTP